MVTRMHILLEPQADSGSVALFENKRFKNVRNMTPKPFDVGAGTVIVGTK